MYTRTRTYIAALALASVAFVFCIAVSYAYAYETEVINTEALGDFVVGPAKVELSVMPGETKTTEIFVTNRTGERRRFMLEIEDAAGSTDPDAGVVLLGNDRGPYSLKDYLSVPEQSFELNQGERARIPVTITVPADAAPGGFYGSVLVSNESLSSTAGSGAVVRSRVGALFFVTVPGDITKSAALSAFDTIPEGRAIVLGDEVRFQMLFDNRSAVHLTPFGSIHIRNLFGREIGVVEVDPWYAMPNATRRREVSFDTSHLFGIYTAEVAIDRSYGNIVDTKKVSFIVLSAKGAVYTVMTLVIAIFFVFAAVRFIRARKMH